MDRSVTPCHSSGPASTPCPRSACRRRCARAAQSRPTCASTASLERGRSADAAGVAQVNTAGGVTSYLWGLINFRGPALLADLKSRPYPHYSFFDLLYSEEQLLAGQKPEVDPSVFRDKIVFVGVTARRACTTCSKRRSPAPDARHPGSRGGGRRLPLESVHAAGVATRRASRSSS